LTIRPTQNTIIHHDAFQPPSTWPLTVRHTILSSLFPTTP
jgi:hypothetical protein